MSAVILWAWDDTNKIYRRLLIDATGHLQIDVAASELPDGAATEVTLDLVRAELDGIEGLLAGGLPAALHALGGLKVVNLFGGSVYVNSDTATDNNARRFEVASKKLRGGIIIVKTHNQLFGDSTGQTYPVAVDETVGFTKVDVSTLYFKNAGADEHGTVHILGVKE